MANVGLSIKEAVANGASAYRVPAKRNIGLLGCFLRGRSFIPTKVTNLEEFNTIFGGQSASFFGPGIVRSIFNNAGNAAVTLYIARVTASNAVVATGTANLGGSATMSVRAGYKGNDDPGSWANGIVVSLYPLGSQSKGMFTLVVTYGETKEQYNYPTLSEIQVAVNKASKLITIEFSQEITSPTYTSITGTATVGLNSKTVTGVGTSFRTAVNVGDVLVDNNGKVIGTVASISTDTALELVSYPLVAVTSAAIQKRNDAPFTATLASGADGEVTEADFYPVESSVNPKGLACFSGYDVQIIAHTEFHSLSLEKKFNQMLNNWKNPIGVINLPLNADEGTAELYANELQTNDRSFLAGAYLGWETVADENGDPMVIPAIGAVLGAAYLKTPYVQGDFIHIPPGGVDGIFVDAIDFTPARLSQTVINHLVQNFSCNVIRYIEGSGYYVGSSRTYSTNPLYQSIHIRQQTSYYVRMLESMMKFLEQKPNTPELKNESLVKLYQFFKAEYDAGALERSIPFDTAYKGICDLSNNPVGQDRKLINIDVLWVPTECTESIQISLQRNDGVLTVQEA